MCPRTVLMTFVGASTRSMTTVNWLAKVGKFSCERRRDGGGRMFVIKACMVHKSADSRHGVRWLDPIRSNCVG